MPSPTFDTYMTSILELLAKTGVMPLRDLYAQAAASIGLTDEQMREVTSSGAARYKTNISWAATYLAKAGAVTKPQRGFYAITERGRALLAEGQPITEKRLLHIPEVAEFVRPTRSTDTAQSPIEPSFEPSQDAPEETIQRLADELRKLVEADLVERLQAVDPLEFERLVLKVLRGMGYGKDGSLNTTKASHDEGIDGIISEDPLGLDRIYMQAKRYQDGSNVGIRDVMAFIGALATHQGDRGVFITSSGFTSDAINAASKTNARIELIDGKRLAKLMVDNQIGVQPRSVTTIYTLDDDFFEEL